MKALILAAGMGTRLLPLTENHPKPMMKICGKPILEHVIEKLKLLGLSELIIVVGYQKEKIMDYFGSGYDLNVEIKYLVQEPPWTSSSSAVLTAKDELSGEAEFVLVHCDFFANEKLIERTITTYRETDADAVIALTLAEDPSRFGVADIDEIGKIRRIIEKPPPGTEPSKFVISSVYVFTPEFFSFLEKVREFDKSIQAMLENGKSIFGAVYEDIWVDVEYPWDLLMANRLVLEEVLKEGSYISRNVDIEKGATVEGPLWISEGVRIQSGASILGPVFLGKDTFIGNNALVRQFTSVGNNVTVGFGVEVKNSLIFDNTILSRLSFVGDSIVGENATIGAGTTFYNYDYGESIKMEVDHNIIDTGLTHFGSVVGDNVKMGINCSIAPGKRIGSNSIISHGVIVDRNVEPNKFVHVEQKISMSDL